MEELKITRERAIKRMEWILKHEIYCSDKLSHAAINMAITALRSAEPENKPLTLEQLQQMDGNPAYVKNIVHPDCTGWKVCGGSFDGYFYFSNGETYELSHYGQTWLAYARKPEGSKKS